MENGNRPVADPEAPAGELQRLIAAEARALVASARARAEEEREREEHTRLGWLIRARR